MPVERMESFSLLNSSTIMPPSFVFLFIPLSVPPVFISILHMTHFGRVSVTASFALMPWPLVSCTLAGTVTERLEGVHIQEAHIDLCCIVINSRHFAEYS